MSRLLFEQILNNGDLRSLNGVDMVIKMVHSKSEFDTLFSCLKSSNRLVVMRAADAIEKISRSHPEYLEPHKQTIIGYSQIAENKELKWHLAQLLPRLLLDNVEFRNVCELLEKWVMDPNESKICRVSALQGLFELHTIYGKNISKFIGLLDQLEQEDIPSLNARIRQLKSKLLKTQ